MTAGPGPGKMGKKDPACGVNAPGGREETEGKRMIGLERGRVALAEHDRAWERLAAEAGERIRRAWGPVALDVQHVGSTAIRHIRAKPILDLAVAVESLATAEAHSPELERAGFRRRGSDVPGQILYVGGVGERRTHHIHVVPRDDIQWANYLNFRDYLNAKPGEAKRYEALKLRLAARYPQDRVAYTAGKAACIARMLAAARAWALLGREVAVTVDRPLGSVHPRQPGLVYPVNYGYVEGVPGGDGAWLDAYVLGPTEPVARFVGQVAGVCYRRDDCEDKLVVIGPGPTPSAGEMAAAIQFQERYFDSHVETE